MANEGLPHPNLRRFLEPVATPRPPAHSNLRRFLKPPAQPQAQPVQQPDNPQKRGQVRESIQQLALQRPELIADMLSTWLDQDASPPKIEISPPPTPTPVSTKGRTVDFTYEGSPFLDVSEVVKEVYDPIKERVQREREEAELMEARHNMSIGGAALPSDPFALISGTDMSPFTRATQSKAQSRPEAVPEDPQIQISQLARVARARKAQNTTLPQEK